MHEKAGQPFLVNQWALIWEDTPMLQSGIGTPRVFVRVRKENFVDTADRNKKQSLLLSHRVTVMGQDHLFLQLKEKSIMNIILSIPIIVGVGEVIYLATVYLKLRKNFSKKTEEKNRK